MVPTATSEIIHKFNKTCIVIVYQLIKQMARTYLELIIWKYYIYGEV